jgi:hypothetical protein
MKKRLNVDQIQSELRGGSAFFPGYHKGDDSPASPSEERKREDSPRDIVHKNTEPATDSKHAQGVPLPVGGTVPPTLPLIPKVRRPIKQRQPFDIYEDQYARLKKIAEAEKGFVNGRSMSQMVREAIDTYLQTHDSPKE